MKRKELGDAEYYMPPQATVLEAIQRELAARRPRRGQRYRDRLKDDAAVLKRLAR